MSNDVTFALLIQTYLNGRLSDDDAAYLLVPFGASVHEARGPDLTRRLCNGEPTIFPIPGCRGLDRRTFLVLREKVTAMDSMPLSASTGWMIPNPPEGAGRPVEGRLVVAEGAAHLAGSDGSDTYEIRNLAPQYLDQMIAGTAPPDRIEVAMRRCLATAPLMVERALSRYQAGLTGFMTPLRHRYPDGLPTPALQPLLESAYPQIREFAIQALGQAASPTRAGRSR